MQPIQCDLLVVGGGPGGYSSAVRGSQRGLKVVLVEQDALGGTCLNRGCLPTKTLLEDACRIDEIRRSHFLKGELRINRRRMFERKSRVVEEAVAGITQVLRAQGVEILQGQASFLGPRSVVVRRQGHEPTKIRAKTVILATGARNDYGDVIEPDGRNIWSTDDALAAGCFPPTFAVIGADARGVELASIFHNLGSKVTLIEKEGRILPRIHRTLARRYQKILTERRIEVLTKTRVAAAECRQEEGLILFLESEKGARQIRVDKALVIGSRRPSYEGLALQAAGLNLSDGLMEHGPDMETAVSGVYVIGDATGPPYLAHKAIAQALSAVDHLLGVPSGSRAHLFPSCVYGKPEIASLGATEYEQKKAGRTVKAAEFYLMNNGRSAAMGAYEGMILLVADAATGELLGVHVMGPRATEMIALGVTAMQHGLTIDRIAKTVLPHMTFSESFFEAAASSHGEAIHQSLSP